MNRFLQFIGGCLPLAGFVALAVALWALSSARGAEYQSPDIGAYYASLRQPDYPGTPCCGWGDAYYADRTDACRSSDGPDCALVAIVTDTRPDRRELPRGRFITRKHVPVGTRVAIPRSKVRRHALPNPTGHNVVFFNDTDFGRQVYCWEPMAGL